MIAPPLRKIRVQEVLWQALKEGGLQTIATDHCSFTKDQKQAGEQDFSKTPCGMPGAETRPALIGQKGVQKNRITMNRCVNICPRIRRNYIGYIRRKEYLLPEVMRTLWCGIRRRSGL